MQEDTQTKEVPKGKLPITSVTKKTTNGQTWGAYFGGKFTSEEVKPVEVVTADSGSDGFDIADIIDPIRTIFIKQREILQKTESIFDRTINNFF